MNLSSRLQAMLLLRSYLRRVARPLHALLMTACACVALVAVGVALEWHWMTFLASVVGLCMGGFALGLIRAKKDNAHLATMREQVADAVVGPREHSETSDLVDEMLAQCRYALLLRPRIVGNLSNEQKRLAEAQLHAQMAPVPAGELLVGIAEDDLAEGLGGALEPEFTPTMVEVEEFLLDRYAVSNRQYHAFVQSGGYKQMALWDPAVWPAVSSFVDTTGQLAPRFWKDGCYPAKQGDHPVVGISWYEAAAYARWVGKRLPSDSEWEKAASWPLPMGESGPRQRRYPWGDSFEPGRVNLWSSGNDATIAVDELPEGTSAGGALQLIGNVWEWTADELMDPRLSPLFPLKSIRGGAFDTYFDNQATCQFRSGETPVHRKHNIGFRCALGICDLRPPAARDAAPGRQRTANSEESNMPQSEEALSI
ncbi:MAG: formylglycine-generating enzyme family protein [Pirellulales bacterium]